MHLILVNCLREACPGTVRLCNRLSQHDLNCLPWRLSIKSNHLLCWSVSAFFSVLDRYLENLLMAGMNYEYWNIHGKTCFITLPYSLYLSQAYAHFLSGSTPVLSPECRGSVTLTFSSMVLEHLSLVLRKPVFGVSDQVPHKSGCTATEDG